MDAQEYKTKVLADEVGIIAAHYAERMAELKTQFTLGIQMRDTEIQELRTEREELQRQCDELRASLNVSDD
jgi:hypothetical protein